MDRCHLLIRFGSIDGLVSISELCFFSVVSLGVAFAHCRPHFNTSFSRQMIFLFHQTYSIRFCNCVSHALQTHCVLLEKHLQPFVCCFGEFIRFVDGVMQVARNSEASNQTSFLAVYNMETTDMRGFYQVIGRSSLEKYSLLLFLTLTLSAFFFWLS